MVDDKTRESGGGTATLEPPVTQPTPPQQAPVTAPPTPTPSTAATPQPKTPDERKAILATAVSNTMGAQGMRVESQSDYQAVLVKGKKVNHWLHGILTFLTLGAWGIVWIAVALFGGETRKILSVDEFGNLNSTLVKKPPLSSAS